MESRESFSVYGTCHRDALAESLYSGSVQYVENRAHCVSSITIMIYDAVAHRSPLKVCISSAQETFISNYHQVVVTCTVLLEQ